MSNHSSAHWKREITQEEFFYVKDDNYDEHVELAIPFYLEMHKELARVLRTKTNTVPWRVLDLGSGTGKTSAIVLNKFEVSRLDAIDLFDSMHGHARRRLEAYSSTVRFITGDFMDLPFDGPYDVCISSLAIHHQEEPGKIAIFRKIRKSMNSDGIFILIDWTCFRSGLSNRLAFDSAHDSVTSHVSDSLIAKNWSEHWRTKNMPSTVEDQCGWLREVGFATVECPIRYWGMAMICAWASALSTR